MKLLILFILINSSFAVENKLLPFTTDGCSKVPDAKFTECCKAHDLDYWKGGTEVERIASDERLYQCVKKESNPFFGSLFYWGVRAGGSPKLSTSFRWGYGWIYKRGYLPLSEKELIAVNNLTPKDPLKVPVTNAVVKISQRPTFFGNYCLDQIHNFLKDEHEETKAEIQIERGQYQTVVKVKLEEIKILFTYKNRMWKKCNSPQYEQVLPKFYKAVYFE